MPLYKALLILQHKCSLQSSMFKKKRYIQTGSGAEMSSRTLKETDSLSSEGRFKETIPLTLGKRKLSKL